LNLQSRRRLALRVAPSHGSPPSGGVRVRLLDGFAQLATRPHVTANVPVSAHTNQIYLSGSGGGRSLRVWVEKALDQDASCRGVGSVPRVSLPIATAPAPPPRPLPQPPFSQPSPPTPHTLPRRAAPRQAADAAHVDPAATGGAERSSGREEEGGRREGPPSRQGGGAPGRAELHQQGSAHRVLWPPAAQLAHQPATGGCVPKDAASAPQQRPRYHQLRVLCPA
jgi:hypothetical protein